MAEMTSDSHKDQAKMILKSLRLPTFNLLHLGRKLGSKMLDLLEEEMKEILHMGQWADGTWDASHFLKLPLGPICQLAGFIGSKMHFDTQTSVVQPHELLQQTPTGRWCHGALDAIAEVAIDTGKHQTV